MNSAEDIEKAMLLQQSGEISIKDLRRLESTLKADPRARETKKMNNAIIRAAREKIQATPMDELSRARILEAGRQAIGTKPSRSMLPWMAAAAVMMLILTLVWAALRLFGDQGGQPRFALEPAPAPAAATDAAAMDVVIDVQLDEIRDLIALVSEDVEDASTAPESSLDRDLNELANELLLLMEMQI